MAKDTLENFDEHRELRQTYKKTLIQLDEKKDKITRQVKEIFNIIDRETVYRREFEYKGL